MKNQCEIMNLIIDQGNTYCKLAVFDENDNSIVEFSENKLSVKVLNALLGKYDISNGIISTVKKTDKEVNDFLNSHLDYFCELNKSTLLPLKIEYKSDTLGADRIAAAVGAWSIEPGKPLLIIDMGTAITFDFVESNGIYKGGNISPGLRLRFNALHNYTDRLPLVDPEIEFESFGTDTVSAIRAGVMQGILSETEDYIRSYKKNYPLLFTFLTGGDLIYFAEKLKNGIFVSKNLVLVGLNRILNYNANK